MNLVKYLNKHIEVKIDRQMGSYHPKYDFIYPINYGYVTNKISGDVGKLDCFVLGIFKPIETFQGVCIAIVHRLNDNDDKLIIAPEGKDFSNEQIETLIEFQERFFEHELIRADIQFNSLIPELSVSNIEVSKNFYENIGFRVIYKRTKDKFCFMQLENNQIMLEENNDNWNVGKMEYPYGNGINISMRLKDVQKKYDELKDKNIKFFLNLEIHEYVVNNKIYKDSEFLIQDPDGYLLRFND